MTYKKWSESYNNFGLKRLLVVISELSESEQLQPECSGPWTVEFSVSLEMAILQT